MRRLLTALMALTLLVSAACGGSSSSGGSTPGTPATSEPSSPRLELISSETATRNAGSAKFAMRMALSMNSTQVMTMTGGGVVGFKPSVAEISVRFAGDKTLGPMNGMRMNERLVDEAVYIQSPLFAGLSGSQKQWVKVDLSQLGMSSAADMSAGQSGDPSQMLEYLRGVTDDVKEVGTEQIRGVETTHYHATTSLQKALERVPEAQRKNLEAMVQNLGDTTIPIDVWVDGDGRVARVATQYSLNINGQSIGADMQFDYFDYGTPIDVKAPPADQVADLGGLSSSLGAS
jgi:hypothetical protein